MLQQSCARCEVRGGRAVYFEARAAPECSLRTVMEYLILIFLHVLFGIFWAGGAIVAGFFIFPSVLDAGPAGGAVMAGVVGGGFR